MRPSTKIPTVFAFAVLISIMVAFAFSCSATITTSDGKTCSSPSSSYILTVTLTGAPNGEYMTSAIGQVLSFIEVNGSGSATSMWPSSSFSGYIYNQAAEDICPISASIPACSSNNLCPLQAGVCAGSKDVSGTVNPDGSINCSASDYGPYYNASGDECDGLDNNCDGIVNGGCSNMLYIDNNFYVCNFTSPSLFNTQNSQLWNNLENRFAFMGETVNGQISPSTIGNHIIGVPTQCEQMGNWYCNSFSNPPLWENVSMYGAANPVNSTSSLTPGWPFGYYNDTIYIIPPNETITQLDACCPGTFCFNGTTCEDSVVYEYNPQHPPVFSTYGQEGYRCSPSGNWNLVSLKYDYNQNGTGYCNDDSSCYANNECYASGNWSLFDGVDRMCDNGNWTTRTKYIAAALLNYTASYPLTITSYELFCDNWKNALDDNVFDLDYVVNLSDTSKPVFDSYFFSGNISGYGPSPFCINNDCINDVCVLRFNDGSDRTILGTSLNLPINETTYPVYQAFGFDPTTSDCQNVVDGSCSFNTGDSITRVLSSSKSGDLFYSGNKQVMFYSAQQGIEVFKAGLVDQIFNILQHPISTIVSLVQSVAAPSNPAYNSLDVLNKISDFDRVYFAKSSGKTINGIQETKYDNESNSLKTIISVTYSGFNENICQAVTQQNPSVTCQNSNGAQVVYYAADPGSPGLNELWQDLTSKIRIH